MPVGADVVDRKDIIAHGIQRGVAATDVLAHHVVAGQMVGGQGVEPVCFALLLAKKKAVQLGQANTGVPGHVDIPRFPEKVVQVPLFSERSSTLATRNS